jgi:GNAT superfamily N-acetyltransferase
LVKRLRFLTNGGWGRSPVGSALIDDIDARRVGDFFLAVTPSDNQVVGWAFVTRRARRTYDQRFVDYAQNKEENKETLRQVGVYVAARHRRKGIGHALLAEILRVFPNRQQLVCCPWNFAGRNLFARWGLPVAEEWCTVYRYRHY